MWSGVELREIRVFLTLAEELHYGRTAERLRLTPSRISQSVRSLEARVGGRLFDRTSRRVGLTPAGEDLRRRVASPYRQLEEAVASTREKVSGISGTVRLGMFSTTHGGPYLLEMVKCFEARHPSCRVAIVDTGFSHDHLASLRSGEFDLLAARLPLSDPDVTIGPVLSSEERVLAVAVDHPLAERRSVCLDDLADFAAVDIPTLPREMMDAFIPPRLPSGRLLRRVECRSLVETQFLIATGEIVHPTVRSFLEHYPHPGVTTVPIRDMPRSHSALVWLTEHQSLKRAAFVRAATDILAAAG